MILRRYGSSYESVETNFDSKALTEIGFRRDRRLSVPTEEFQAKYERLSGHELTATAEGDVHDEAEQRMLVDLERQLDAILSEMSDDQVLVVESEQGSDYPKTRSVHKKVVVEGENRLYFIMSVEPALRVAVYGRTAAS